MGQKSMRIWIYLAALLLFMLVFPAKIKIQFSSDQEVAQWKGYADGRLATPVCELHHVDRLYWGVMSWKDFQKAEHFYLNTLQDCNPVLSGIKIAFGNHLLLSDCAYTQDDTEIRILNLQNGIKKRVYIYQICYCMAGMVLLYLLHRKMDVCENRLKYAVLKIQQLLGESKPYLYAGFAAILCSAVVNMFLEMTGLGMGVHAYEFTCLMLALAMVFCLLKKRTGSVQMACIGCLAVSIPFFVSVERMLTFLTVDEPNAVACITKFPFGRIYPWMNNVCRVSYVVMGTLWKLVPQGIGDAIELNVSQQMKVMHWLCGALFVILIVDFAQNKILNVQRKMSAGSKVFCYVILFYAMLLLPVVELGLKNYNNYDMFSMFLCVYGFEWLYAVLRDQNLKYGWAGMVMELLAVMEKLNAVIFYVAAGAVMVLLYGLRQKKPDIKTIAAGIGKIMAVSLCVSLAVHIYVIYILGGNHLMIMPWKQVVTVLAETAVRLVWEVGKICHVDVLSHGYTLYTLGCSLILLVTGMGVFGWILIVICRHWNSVWQEKAKAVAMAFVLIVFAAGIAMVYGWIQTDNETWKYAVKIMKIVVNAIPSVYLIAAAALLVLVRKQADFLLSVILAVGIIGFLAAYIIIRPFDHERYMNMYLCTIVLILTVLFLQAILDWLSNWRIRSGAACLFAVVLLADVWPSAPAYTFFYPVWNHMIQKGEKGIYVYWGEQIAVIGEKIEKYCKENQLNLDQVKIYEGYGGNWLENNYDIELVGSTEWANDMGICGMTEHDFYIFDSQAVMRGMVPQLPQAEPVMVIRYKVMHISLFQLVKQLIRFIKSIIFHM